MVNADFHVVNAVFHVVHAVFHVVQALLHVVNAGFHMRLQVFMWWMQLHVLIAGFHVVSVHWVNAGVQAAESRVCQDAE